MAALTNLKLPEDCRPQFSGHETFPLRQLWPSKIAHLIIQAQRDGRQVPISGADAIVELGVGKNMVSSMRFWAQACGIVNREDKLTDFGELIFGTPKQEGSDPYCSSAATVWLFHWKLASRPDAFTPIWYLFNQVNSPTLDREAYVLGMEELVKANGWNVSKLSLRRAEECVLRSYLPRMSSKGRMEDFVEPLLASLHLLEVTNSRDVFGIRRSSHRSLPDAVFAYAMLEYWDRLSTRSVSLDFTRIAHDFGSPGRVFKLDADSIVDRLQRLSELTAGCLEWTEQAGLRQVIRRRAALENPEAFRRILLWKAYC